MKRKMFLMSTVILLLLLLVACGAKSEETLTCSNTHCSYTIENTDTIPITLSMKLSYESSDSMAVGGSTRAFTDFHTVEDSISAGSSKTYEVELPTLPDGQHLIQLEVRTNDAGAGARVENNQKLFETITINSIDLPIHNTLNCENNTITLSTLVSETIPDPEVTMAVYINEDLSNPYVTFTVIPGDENGTSIKVPFPSETEVHLIEADVLHHQDPLATSEDDEAGSRHRYQSYCVPPVPVSVEVDE